jgi:hypothetical protein
MIKYECLSPISLLKLPFWGVKKPVSDTPIFMIAYVCMWQVTCHPSLALEKGMVFSTSGCGYRVPMGIISGASFDG